MARRAARARTRTTRSSSTMRSSGSSRGGGGGLAKYLIPAAALTVAAVLLWPKKIMAAPPPPGVRPAGPPIGPPIVPPPLPGPTGLSIDPVADAPLNPGETRGRVRANDVVVRSGPNENTQPLARLPQRGGVAILGALEQPTAAAPNGWQPIRTARGVNGYVAAQLLTYED